jgi:TOMM system kinase/cyclase fusion protein
MQYVFGDYSLDPAHYELRHAGRLVPVEPRVFDLLAYLVQHAGQTVTTEALLAHLYPNQFAPVERLTTAVAQVRKVLGETSQSPRYIETVRRRGYRFMAPVDVYEPPARDARPAPAPDPPRPAEAPHPDPAAGLSAAAPVSFALPPPSAAPQDWPDAERRQLTVLFCDLVGSTVLAGQLDPEELREVVRAYQATCTKVITGFEGHIAQYLGDGVLVYFGYPLAHEDDAQRAVRAGLGMVEAVGQLNTHLERERGVRLAVRLGIHTGLVVVGAMGEGARQEHLALGETPNLAARLQALARPNTLLISAATWQLLGGFFACQALDPLPLQGRAQPLAVYQVLSETTARSRLDAASSTGLTPLVGREQEIGLLQERWAQVKEGLGQMVLLSGEAGIGKSRLVQVLKEQVAIEPQAWLTPCQCSPYHQHTALYPWIDLLERVVLRFTREESAQQKLSKLEGHLVQYGLPLAEALPLFATLLSLPLPSAYAPLHGSPEQQKQQTLHALLTILLRIAAQQPLLLVVEDLHWVDPSTLELLSLLVDQGPTARILMLLTCRPDFRPPWIGRSHCTQVTLSRLPRRQAAELTGRVAHGKALPPEVVEQIVARTDGVPLFVEELTKMVLDSGLLQERDDGYALTGPLPSLAIPGTLHDSLMARLDRLGAAKGLAQLGATLGHEFSSALLQAISPWDEATVQRGLHQLVTAEFLYQRGVPPQTTYVFKHALIQDAAYQSLLRSTRQQYHQRIAQVLEARFPEVSETQPEVLAHHYTEAALMAQALPWWQQAGQRALQRSANLEAIAHLTKGLAVLATLPDTTDRLQHELDLHVALGSAVTATKGYASPEAEHTCARAWEICQRLGEPPQRFPVLYRLCAFYFVGGKHRQARDQAEAFLRLAQRQEDAAPLVVAHRALGVSLFWMGEVAQAREHFLQSVALYDPQQHRTLAFAYGQDPGVAALVNDALTLWILGYPDQALRRSHAACRLAEDLAHPHTLAYAFAHVAMFHQYRRDREEVRQHADAAIRVSREQGFPFWLGAGLICQGWAQMTQHQLAEPMPAMHEGLALYRATDAAMWVPYFLTLLAEAYGAVSQPETGLRLLDEARTVMDRTQERFYAAEVHRVHGALVLAQAADRHPLAETCFQHALDIARRQQARSWELRAAVSLSRLWQQHGKRDAARELLVPVYGWFTEGFDTADLQEAKALLEELGA